MHLFLRTCLLEGGHKADRTIEHFQRRANEGDTGAKDFIRAIAIGKPTTTPMPFAPGAATAPSTLPKDATMRQQVQAAYQAKQTAPAVVQKAEKTVAAKDIGRQKVRQLVSELEEKIAAAKDRLVQEEDDYVDARAKLQEANQQESLASQKLETLRVLQEQQAHVAPAAEVGSLRAQHTAAAAGSGAGGPAFDIDALPADTKAKLDEATQGMGIDANRMRDFVSLILGVAAVQFAGKQMEAAASEEAKDDAKTGAGQVQQLDQQPQQPEPQQQQQQPAPTPPEQSQQPVPPPDFETDRSAPGKRDRPSEEEEKQQAEDDAAAEEAANHLFDEDQEVGQRQRSRSPKGRDHPTGKKACSKAVAKEDGED